MDHSRPERFGRYRVIDVLGEGGMGVVYAAVDERLGRPVALKVLRAAFAADSSSRERFWREAQLAARINHPRICQLHDVGDQDGQLFLVMERLEGESLAHRLKRGPLPIGDTIPIVLEILVALAGSPAIAVADRVIHRALSKSPTNRYRDATAMAEDLRLAALADSAIGGQYARQITRVTVMPLRLLRPDPEIAFVCFSSR